MKNFEELDVIDDFLMNAVAGDEKVGKSFCKILLNGLLQAELENFTVNVQRILFANTPEQRGIRMDVEIIESRSEVAEEIDSLATSLHLAKNIYDIEPNLSKSVNLPKHNRFYQAKIDSRAMKAGEKKFDNLPNLYIITITNYDPFGYMMYTIHNKCDEIDELNYKDGLRFIYFNTKGTKGGTASLQNLLNYLQHSCDKNVVDETTAQIHQCVTSVKSLSKVRDGYMTLEEYIYYAKLDAEIEAREEGHAKGLAEGLETGRAEGIKTGRAEGLETGRAEVFRTTICLMRKKLSDSEIADILQQPLEKILEVQ